MSGPRSHHLSVERTARVVTLGGPQSDSAAVSDAVSGAVSEAWFVCHGYRQLAARFIRRFTGIAGPERIVVAPEGLSRFYVDPTPGRHGPDSRVGATWMTREDREAEINDYVRYLDKVAGQFGRGARTRVALGFSQGVHTVARWVAMGHTPIDRAIFWGAYLPGDLDLEAYRDRLTTVELIQVHGERDPARSSELEKAQDQRLDEAGLEVRRLYHEGGHEIDADLLGSLA